LGSRPRHSCEYPQYPVPGLFFARFQASWRATEGVDRAGGSWVRGRERRVFLGRSMADSTPRARPIRPSGISSCLLGLAVALGLTLETCAVEVNPRGYLPRAQQRAQQRPLGSPQVGPRRHPERYYEATMKLRGGSSLEESSKAEEEPEWIEEEGMYKLGDFLFHTPVRRPPHTSSELGLNPRRHMHSKHGFGGDLLPFPATSHTHHCEQYLPRAGTSSSCQEQKQTSRFARKTNLVQLHVISGRGTAPDG